MTGYCDAHIHLGDNWWSSEDISRLMDGGGLFCDNAVREQDWISLLERAGIYPCLVPFIGLHPWYADTASYSWEHTLRSLLDTHADMGIGEIGLDRCCRVPFAVQLRVFRVQLHLALDRGRPVSIHCVRAWGKLVEELEQASLHGARIMIHSFSGSLETMHRLTRLGVYCSFSPMACTQKGRKPATCIQQVPDSLVLLESDAPSQLPEELKKTDHVMAYTQTMDTLYKQVADIRNISELKLRELAATNGAVFTNQAITG